MFSSLKVFTFITSPTSTLLTAPATLCSVEIHDVISHFSSSFAPHCQWLCSHTDIPSLPSPIYPSPLLSPIPKTPLSSHSAYYNDLLIPYPSNCGRNSINNPSEKCRFSGPASRPAGSDKFPHVTRAHKSLRSASPIGHSTSHLCLPCCCSQLAICTLLPKNVLLKK